MITAYFYHISTGAPLTDTSVNVYVTVSNARADVKVVDNKLMTPMTSFPGGFKHGFECDSEIDYMVSASADDPNYAYQIDKVFIPAVRSGGGYMFSGINTNIGNVLQTISKLEDEIKKLKEFIKDENNETNDHIDAVTVEITTKIEGIEIPEMKMEEKEAKKTQKTVEKLDKKITSYIESEMKEKDDREAEKEEIKMKLEEKDRIIEEKQKLIDEMEDLHEVLMGSKDEDMEKEKENIKNKLISSLSE